MTGPRPGVKVWLGWFAALVLVTALLVSWRERLSAAHIVLAYLLLCQIAAATAGRLVGMLLAVISFLSFNYFLLPPYYSLALANPLDWIVLVAFLLSSALTAELLHRLRREATTARQHAAEVERLANEAREATALREAARLKDALLASVSHDLRTPLTTIKALAHESAMSGNPQAQMIEEEADRMTHFVIDLLDMARLRGGALEVHPEPNEAEDLVGAALQRMKGPAAGREIITTLDHEHPVLFGTFDFSASLRVLVNLLENAIKYSDPGEPVSLVVRRDADSLVFDVADRGPGIPPSDVERLFAPFVRGRTGDNSSGGSGLGLTIARGIAEAQGGTVTYAPRPGGGSVFSFRVPAIDVDGS